MLNIVVMSPTVQKAKPCGLPMDPAGKNNAKGHPIHSSKGKALRPVHGSDKQEAEAGLFQDTSEDS